MKLHNLITWGLLRESIEACREHLGLPKSQNLRGLDSRHLVRILGAYWEAIQQDPNL